MSRQKGWTADKICKELDIKRFSEGRYSNRMQNAEQNFDHGNVLYRYCRTLKKEYELNGVSNEKFGGSKIYANI